MAMKPRTRRILHRSCFAIVALVTLVALFYAEEDWRGARAWDRLRRELAARGESLDPRDFIPPPVPDDQNLALAPLFVRAFRYKVDPDTGLLTFDPKQNFQANETYTALQEMPWGHEQLKTPIPSSLGNWGTGHPIDLARVQQYFRQRKDFPVSPQPQTPARDVLLALTRYAPLLGELATEAATRPQTRFPVNYTLRPAWNIALPQYNFLQKLTTTLRLRALAEMADGQMQAARRDLALGLRLRQSMVNDPTLIAGLVDMTSLGFLLQPIWEGLAARQWSAEDLDELGTALRGINVLREYRRESAGGERALFLGQLPDELQRMSDARALAALMGRFGEGGQKTENLYWVLLPYLPRGWYAQNAALGSRLEQTYMIDPFDPVGHRVDVARAKEFAPVMAKLPLRPDTFIVKQALPVFVSVALKFAQTQTAVDEATTACALERYFLDHHAYPGSLDALVPVYFDRAPNDVIDGAPLRYRPTGDGRYLLYSVGWDGRDDGGSIEWPADRTWRQAAVASPYGRLRAFPSPVRDRGDWVWQYAPAEPPDPPANRSRLE